jgi:hypothetical protein
VFAETFLSGVEIDFEFVCPKKRGRAEVAFPVNFAGPKL